MKNVLLLFVGLTAFSVQAQVGISNTNPRAQLDISASNPITPANTDGILIPRVNAFPAVNPTADQNGMLVFLTSVSGTNQPGFYYWNQPTTAWMGIGSTTANQWNLAGNAGTSTATNFIGTTDDSDLIFRRNNIPAGRIGMTNTFFGHMTGANNPFSKNTYIGALAGSLNASGFDNTFLGYRAGGNGIAGAQNIAIGVDAGLVNTANLNIFVGNAAGNSNATGNLNVYVGHGAGGPNLAGSQNTYIGTAAGSIFPTGTQSVLLGYNAELGAPNLTNATAIGANARVATSNSMVLGTVAGENFATSSVNVGIGTSAPAERLHVVGKIRMVDGSQGAGRIMISDANGTASWGSSVANAAWTLIGNAIPSPATNFIGTTNDRDLLFRRNNAIAGRIGNTSTSFGNMAMNTVMPGTSNAAFGRQALQAGTGNQNTAIGTFSLANTTADNNTGVGQSSLVNNTTGSSNTAVGFESLYYNDTGTRNVAIGQYTLAINITGEQNTAIGHHAGVGGSALVNATAIGARAQVGISNAMVLGSVDGLNGAISSVNVGIGTTAPQTSLDVVDENVVTSSGLEGNVNIASNNDQAANMGGSLSFGGRIANGSAATRTFGTIEGRKANSTTANTAGYLILKTNAGNSLTERMRITATGDIGIGTANPGGQFEISLNEGRKPGSNFWTVTSDKRLKTVNGDYSKGLADIIKLRPIRYHYKNVNERTFDPKVLDEEFAGFLAQEVQKIFPEAVATDRDGYLNFNMQAIAVASVNAIRELNDKNAQLETALQSQNAKVKNLENELTVQKQLLQSILERLPKE